MFNEEQDDDEYFYVIKDIDEFINHTRTIVFGAFGEDFESDEAIDHLIDRLTEQDKKELDETLSKEECLAIVHDHVKPKTNRRGITKYIISDKQFETIIEAFNARLVSNLLTNLVQKGLIESAYDAEENDFIFWVPDNKDIEKKDE